MTKGTFCRLMLVLALVLGEPVIAGGADTPNQGAASNAPNNSGQTSSSSPTPELVRLEPRFDLSPTEAPERPVQIKSSKSITISGGVQERDVVIDWDAWHNKVAEAVMAKVFNNWIEALNVRSGSTTWYQCEITADKRVKSAKVTKSSGDLWYDTMVLNAAYKLDGRDVLAFPPGSKRAAVTTSIGIRKDGRQSNYMVIGDTEFSEVEPAELDAAGKVPNSK